tara:strand:+ start:531 stop:1157 length:627 start_codon:yes stop_codon:yes gene_type:complete
MLDDLVGDGNLFSRTQSCLHSYPVIQNYGLCFDVGTNVGGFSNAWWKKFDKIVAIEAHPKIYEFALNNLSLFSNVEVINKAVGAKEDEYLTFYSHLGGDSGSTSCISTANHDTNSGVKVPTVSYQSLVAEYGVPEYMKVDCEGSEYDFLINQDLTGVRFLSIEVHYDFLTEQQRKELLQYLATYFNVYHHLKGRAGVCHDEYSFIARS